MFFIQSVSSMLLAVKVNYSVFRLLLDATFEGREGSTHIGSEEIIVH
jgi:hypothetical protein